jgi:TPR repeat protein
MEARRAAVRENWFYVYDKKDMQQFLDKNKETLVTAGWPTQADQFVNYMSQVSAPANTAIFDLIHASYGGDPETGNNGWLRRNSGTTPERDIQAQQAGAELSRQRYKAMQESDSAAVEWFRQKAVQGHMGAMSDLSDMYAQGRGCKQDMVEAAYWYRLMEQRRGPAALRSDAPDTYARIEQPDFHLSKAQEQEVAERLAASSPRRTVTQAPRA